MLIEPVKNVSVKLKCRRNQQVNCKLIQLTEADMKLTSADYLDKDSLVEFSAQFFRGCATIIDINFDRYLFTYSLSINSIKFQPGLLVNTQL